MSVQVALNLVVTYWPHLFDPYFSVVSSVARPVAK